MARTAASSRAKMVRFFILTSSKSVGAGDPLQNAFRRYFYCVVLLKGRHEPTQQWPQKACREKPAASQACISINSLDAKCPGCGGRTQVLSFHTYCTLSFRCDASLLAVILAGADIKTACTSSILPPEPLIAEGLKRQQWPNLGSS